MPNQASPRHILITGASSGIGAALAEAYAAPGIKLALLARDETRARAVAETCRAKGAETAVLLADVTDGEVMHMAVTLVDDAEPLDLVIANAGIAAATSDHGGAAARIFAVNVMGVVNTVEPLLPRFMQRRRGHIALMSSLASFLPSPRAAAYSASKVAVRIWGEAMGVRLAPHNVRVSVICPGFIDTPLTQVNRFPMPMIMPADRAAALIKRRLDAGVARIAFPRAMYAAARAANLLPATLLHRASRGWPSKE